MGMRYLLTFFCALVLVVKSVQAADCNRLGYRRA